MDDPLYCILDPIEDAPRGDCSCCCCRCARAEAERDEARGEAFRWRQDAQAAFDALVEERHKHDALKVDRDTLLEAVQAESAHLRATLREVVGAAKDLDIGACDLHPLNGPRKGWCNVHSSYARDPDNPGGMCDEGFYAQRLTAALQAAEEVVGDG